MRIFFLLCLVPLWAASPTLAPAPVEPLQVLWIGNSYTAQTQAYLAGFVAADASVELEAGVATQGGWTLWDHYANRLRPSYDGNTRSLEQKLQEKTWDVVILQEQSTRPSQAWLGNPSELAAFKDGVLQLDAYVRQWAPNATLRYFQTWPRAQGAAYLQAYFGNEPLAMHKATRAAYGAAAAATMTLITPVGDAWMYSMDQNPALDLHKPDLSHPDVPGAYLTGAVFYAFLFEKSPQGSSFQANLSTTDSAWLQTVAYRTWIRLGS
ncbi:MAG: hypothetical protein DWQ01_15475 [Planctomycetota bacterium]|nr:MAG: hypothetical protein DWQ01_15475 [Planctomycetota bacterium]